MKHEVEIMASQSIKRNAEYVGGLWAEGIDADFGHIFMQTLCCDVENDCENPRIIIGIDDLDDRINSEIKGCWSIIVDDFVAWVGEYNNGVTPIWEDFIIQKFEESLPLGTIYEYGDKGFEKVADGWKLLDFENVFVEGETPIRKDIKTSIRVYNHWEDCGYLKK